MDKIERLVNVKCKRHYRKKNRIKDGKVEFKVQRKMHESD